MADPIDRIYANLRDELACAVSQLLQQALIKPQHLRNQNATFIAQIKASEVFVLRHYNHTSTPSPVEAQNADCELARPPAPNVSDAFSYLANQNSTDRHPQFTASVDRGMGSYPTHYVDGPNDESPLGFPLSSSGSPLTLLSPTNSGQSSHEDGLCVRSSPPSPPLPEDVPEDVLIGKENALCNQQQFMCEEENENAEDVAFSLRTTTGRHIVGKGKG
ncbi:hypothetical protein EPUS_09457 [Endocarpon pusillum Z07020]|uniref:Uncharacterized protein n=1 Tax=Endocarpon pusillum (strain Z07020 / HMAS-L-300199) TaxID=1263415 RepID=U1FTG7_ENDPU|nr:uncharacterized protein EPUS_09457 [Endocarpon pusillum Z07020]ERF68057.1 hypothetical protein EPUS_09457 [Endocarpon pusillum Z07020]